jgi:hypothetical protein
VKVNAGSKAMTMSKTDYEAIADKLRHRREALERYESPETYAIKVACWRDCVNAVAEACMSRNIAFQRARFMDRAGYHAREAPE